MTKEERRELERIRRIRERYMQDTSDKGISFKDEKKAVKRRFSLFGWQIDIKAFKLRKLEN